MLAAMPSSRRSSPTSPASRLARSAVTVEGDTVLLTWSGSHADGRSAEGVDTFVISDDLINVQTLVYQIR